MDEGGATCRCRPVYRVYNGHMAKRNRAVLDTKCQAHHDLTRGNPDLTCAKHRQEGMLQSPGEIDAMHSKYLSRKYITMVIRSTNSYIPHR